MNSRSSPKILKIRIRLGKKIAELILQKGYPSLENFALSNGIHKSTIHQVVMGTVDTRVSTLIRISESLEITLEKLMGEVGI